MNIKGIDLTDLKFLAYSLRKSENSAPVFLRSRASLIFVMTLSLVSVFILDEIIRVWLGCGSFGLAAT